MGDAISVEDGDGVGGLNNVYVTATGALADTQSMVIQGPTGGVTPLVIFVPTDVPDQSKPVTFDFTGRFDAGGTVRVCVNGATGICSFLVRLMDGDVVVNGQVVGSYTPQGEHRMLFTMFPELDSYSFAMTGEASVPQNLSGPLTDPNSFPVDNLNFSIRLEDAGIGDSYLMDNVRIRVRN